MRKDSNIKCANCGSLEVYKANSYKHYCLICYDCNNVTHIKKKNRLLFEYFLPRKLFKNLLPEKAFMRLFSDKGDFNHKSFYDSFVNETSDITEKRLSDIDQVLDTLAYFDYNISNKKILDVSGGPGIVGGHLNSISKECKITEHSELAAKAITEKFGIVAKRFDYNKDVLENIYDEKFDLILIRSSIIFCEDVDSLINSCSKMLTKGGCLLVESIIPSLGEVLWWQSLEYKFPRIHSQETLEKYCYKNNFKFVGGFREYDSYLSVKNRSYTEMLGKRLFTWLVDFPLYILYSLGLRSSKISIDQRNIHKMVIQFWTLKNIDTDKEKGRYKNFYMGDKVKSKHFGFVYNGYLKKFKN